MEKGNPVALIPILVFVALYLGLGIILEYVLGQEMGFYSIPVLLIFLIALAVAYLQTKGVDSKERFSIMSKGAGDPNVFMMVLIFLCAGVFTGVMNRSGAESVANFVLTYIPIEYAVIVIFVVSAFVSISMGTSCGTITVLTPIAVSIAEVGDKKFKISFRTKQYVNAAICAKCFGGGGHIRAAGCRKFGYLEDVYAEVLAVAKERLHD